MWPQNQDSYTKQFIKKSYQAFGVNDYGVNVLTKFTMGQNLLELREPTFDI